MLKTLLIVCTVTVNISYGMPTNNLNFETLANNNKMMFFNAVREKCYQNATEAEYEQFVNLTDTSMKCLTNKVKKVPIFVTPLKEFKDHIQECFDHLIGELEECLPEESKDWPQINFDITYAVFDFVYENKDQLMSPKFTSYIENCVESFQDEKARTEISKCFTGYDSKPLEAKVVCEVLTEVENCTMTQLEKRCPADPDTEELKQNLLATLKEPCLEYETTEDPATNVFTLLSPYAPPNMNPELM